MLSKFLNDESGATAIEYALLVAMIAIAIVASVGKVGNTLIPIFNNVANYV